MAVPFARSTSRVPGDNSLKATLAADLGAPPDCGPFVMTNESGNSFRPKGVQLR